MGARQGGKAGLGGRELRDRDGWFLGVEVERRAVLGLGRREAIQRPVAGPHGVLHVRHRLRHVDAVRDAGRVSDDEARAWPGLGLDERLRRLDVVRANGDLGDVDVAVGPGDCAQVLLGDALSGGGELGDRAAGGGLGGLPAGVGIDLSVEDEDVDVPPARQDVIEPAEADVVGPPVATDDPDAFAHQGIGNRRQVDRRAAVLVGVRKAAEHGSQLGHALALGPDPRLGRLVGRQDLGRQLDADDGSQLLDEQRSLAALGFIAEPHPEAELGVVLEQRVVPRRAPSFGVRRPRRGRQVGAVDRRAPGGVRDDHAVAEQLGDELDVRGLATAGAGARELEQRLQRLGALHRIVRQGVAVDLGKRQEEVP